MEACLVKFHRDVWECKGHMAATYVTPLDYWLIRLMWPARECLFLPYSSTYISPEVVYFVREEDLAWGEDTSLPLRVYKLSFHVITSSQTLKGMFKGTSKTLRVVRKIFCIKNLCFLVNWGWGLAMLNNNVIEMKSLRDFDQHRDHKGLRLHFKPAAKHGNV